MVQWIKQKRADFVNKKNRKKAKKAIGKIMTVPENFLIVYGGLKEGLSKEGYDDAYCRYDRDAEEYGETTQNANHSLSEYLPESKRVYSNSDIQAIEKCLEKNATILFSLIRDSDKKE